MLSQAQLIRKYNELAIKAARALEAGNTKLYKRLARRLNTLCLQLA